MGDPVVSFLQRNKEKAEFNQYWYSESTIRYLAEECEQNGKKIAFLSTPSIYFAVAKNKNETNCYLFDFDDAFEKRCNGKWVKFDFNDSNTIPLELHGTFDMIVIDPPFITAEVWNKYIQATRLLKTENAKIIATTIVENKELLKDGLQVEPQVYRPCIPNLVYQYEVYINYASSRLSNPNPEIP